jgi:hypothetical protein
MLAKQDGLVVSYFRKLVGVHGGGYWLPVGGEVFLVSTWSHYYVSELSDLIPMSYANRHKKTHS